MQYCVAISTSSFAQADSSPLKLLEDAGVDIKQNPYKRKMTEAEIIQHLQKVDGLLAGLEPLTRKVFSSVPRLKAAARVGIGMSNVDINAAKDLGVKVSNTPEEPALAVAEMTLAALLAIGRRLVSSNAALHAGKWQKSIGFGLTGTKVLLIGYGYIGKRVKKLLDAFGAEVLVCDPFLSADKMIEGERLISLREGIKEAEVVSLHASGTDVILSEDEFKNMRDGVVILNSARGELVDEKAMIQALEAGKVAGAWFDAFWKEPYKGHLADFDNVLMTPHISTYTRQCRLNMEISSVNNLLRDLGL
jgi:D-3-phosphoglycerate dehydrogenase